MEYTQISNKIAQIYNQVAQQISDYASVKISDYSSVPISNYAAVPISLSADVLSAPKRLHDHLFHYFNEVYEESDDVKLLDSARANAYMMQQTFSVLVGYVGFVANSALSEQSPDNIAVALSIAAPIFLLSAPVIKAWDCLVEDCDGDVFPRLSESVEQFRLSLDNN